MAEDRKLRQGRGDIKQTGADKYEGRTNQDDRQHRTQGLARVYPGHAVLDTCNHNRKGGQCHERACAKEHASNDPVTRPDLLYLVWLGLAARGRAKHSIPNIFSICFGMLEDSACRRHAAMRDYSTKWRGSKTPSQRSG